MIKENEIIDELNINNLKIIQADDDFKYGTDAVMLAKYANILKNAKVLDLCTGSGIVPILLTAFSNSSHIIALEYFEHIANRARRSVELNNLDSVINIMCGDLKNISELIDRESFDHVTVNPPYKQTDSGAKNKSDIISAARHEILCNLDDVVKAADFALKYGGKLTMVHRADRTVDVISTFRKYKIEPKRMALVIHNIKSSPKLILIEGKKGAKSGLVFEPPVIIENNR